MNHADFLTSQQVEFLDDEAIEWAKVRRVRSLFYQRFHYDYPGPIHNLKQRLVVIPAERYGAQQVCDHYLAVQPTPIATRQAADRFGNRVVEMDVPLAEKAVSFEVLMIVESEIANPQQPSISPTQAKHWRKTTHLTEANPQIQAIASELKAEAKNPRDLAQRIHDWVYATMRYESGVTTVSSTAGEALEVKAGLCQDYAHLMLAICRATGLAARYVSGHLLGEGGSHAWVEVFLPSDKGLSPVAFDPTNNRQPHLGYITVAVGRDYRDVSPTSGSFTAPYNGHLTVKKRAGLTLVEYLNGEIAESQPVQ